MVLQCRAEGYPAPTIQWLHYGTVIREMLNITVGEEVANSTSVVSSLEMRGLQARQYGQYQCRASGAVDSETATLSFSGRTQHTHTLYFVHADYTKQGACTGLIHHVYITLVSIGNYVCISSELQV